VILVFPYQTLCHILQQKVVRFVGILGSRSARWSCQQTETSTCRLHWNADEAAGATRQSQSCWFYWWTKKPTQDQCATDTGLHRFFHYCYHYCQFVVVTIQTFARCIVSAVGWIRGTSNCWMDSIGKSIAQLSWRMTNTSRQEGMRPQLHASRPASPRIRHWKGIPSKHTFVTVLVDDVQLFVPVHQVVVNNTEFYNRWIVLLQTILDTADKLMTDVKTLLNQN